MGNIVYIGGVVKSPVYFNNDVLNVDLSIYRPELGKSEELTVIATDINVIKKAATYIHEGDYFLTSDARLRTVTYNRRKELECSECYNTEIQRVKSERTEVVFNDFTTFPVKEGLTPIGVNKVILYGNVCSDLNYREKDGRSYCKYKMAINHKIYDTDAEYPFVVTFGKDAELSNKYLKRNSRVFVEGSIQQRLIKQSTEFVCSVCGTRATKKVPHTVREIITNTVIFLDKKDDESKEQ